MSVTLDPARVVSFALAKGIAPSVFLIVSNNSPSHHVAFKIMSTAPLWYIIHPPNGTLAPRASAIVTLQLREEACDGLLAMPDPTAVGHKFLVRTLDISESDAGASDVPALFASAPMDQIVSERIKCAFTQGTTASNVVRARAPSSPAHKLVQRARSRSRSGSGDATAVGNHSPTMRQLVRLQSDRKVDEQRRVTLTTFRDDDVRNRTCFNCVDIQSGGVRPTHVCLDYGTFVCGMCATIHREFEHCVKAIEMSKFSDEEVAAVLKSGGNARAHAQWRKTMDKSYRIPGATVEEKARQIVWFTFVERIWTGEKNVTAVQPMPKKPASPRRKISPTKNSVTSHSQPNVPCNTVVPTQLSVSAPTKSVTNQETPWDRLLPRLVKSWAWLRDIQVESQWQGDPVCITADRSTSPYEKEMRAKLAFVKTALKLKQDGAVFAGTTMLRGISDPSFPEKSLFLAMEVMNMRTTGIFEAFSDIENYAYLLGQAKVRAHPLMLLALARCAVAMNTESTPPTVAATTIATARELLQCFCQMYPDASKIWLTESDNEVLHQAPVPPPPVGTSTTKPLTPEQLEWQELQRRGAKPSDAMDELLKLVGLKRVKVKALQLFKTALSLQKLSPERRKKNSSITLNFCFTGNPGTGKTTVAKLFAQILVDSGMRRTPSIAVCGPQQLKDGGADEFRKTISQAMGGVLFIDEAYDLDPKSDPKGKPIMAELLLAAEELRGDLSIILAGYEDDIQEKLYSCNEGLRSRFESVPFDDFDESDLLTIWDALTEDKGWVGENANVRVIACRRLARGANRKGFGNARAVRQLVESATTTAFSRDDIDHKNLTLRIVDVIGERPANNPKLHAVLKEIEAKIGWTKIKERARELVDLCDTNYERELAAGGANSTQVAATIPVALHRLFLGNPGTGKTTFASLYGKLLKHLNLLSDGEVVKKTAGDFIGAYMGQSQRNTCDILQQAKGKVLIIDEAYNLNDGMYGKQVLDVLVEKVQGHENEDLAVILIGYEAQMAEMFRTQNPGLVRRFPMEFAFFFDDYIDLELLQIFAANCKKMQVIAPLDVQEAVIKSLSMQRKLANFGNAGAVEQLLKNAMANAMARLRRNGRGLPSGAITLELADIASEVTRRSGGDADDDEGNRDPLSLLDGLFRMESIRKKLSVLAKHMKVSQKEGKDEPPVGHFVFRGSPGTGKTTVARVMGSILFRMGVLGSDRVVETTGLNMTGEYTGQTKKKVEMQLQEARGAILFIDEAYEMGKGSYGEEALTSLVAAMTDPTYKGTVVIIAGYTNDIDQMLNRNAGLKSRFTRFFDFEDWELDDCMAYLNAKAAKGNYTVEASADLVIHDIFKQLRTMPGFGNGRDVDYVWNRLLECRSERVCDDPEPTGQYTIQAEDAREASDVILKARAPPPGGAFPTNHSHKSRRRSHYSNNPYASTSGAYLVPSSNPSGGGFHNNGHHGNNPHVITVPQSFEHTKNGHLNDGMQSFSSQSRPQSASTQRQNSAPNAAQASAKAAGKATQAKTLDADSDNVDDSKDDNGDESKGAASERDPGVSDADWLELEAAKENYKQLLAQIQREEDARKAREEAERKLREFEEEQRRLQEEADRLAREEAERLAREEEERKRLEHLAYLEKLRQQEEDARREEELRRLQEEADRLAKEEAERLAKEEAERKLRAHRAHLERLRQEEEAARKAKEEQRRKEEAERKARAEAARKAREEIERKAREEAERKRQEHLARLEKLRKEEEAARKLKEEAERKVREYEAKRQRLRQLMRCPAGYEWYQVGGGWRCSAGGHFVSDAQLEQNYTRYV